MKKILLIAIIIIATVSTYAQSWLLTGNSGTTPGTNFIGTTDAKAFTIKVNNQRSGYIDFASGTANTLFGYQALKGGKGNSNSAFGYKASFSNTTGNNNISVGAYALYSNTLGYSNIAIGQSALYTNSAGSNSIAIGDSALYNFKDKYNFNLAIGSKTLFKDSLGYNNTAIGFNALYSNLSGAYNSAIGTDALFANTNGSGNIAIGYESLISNTTGSGNIALGNSTLDKNISGNQNTAIGSQTLFENTTGSDNVAIGFEALSDNSTGYSNTAIGLYALVDNTTGSNNTSAGSFSLFANTTGTNNNANGYESLFENNIGSYNVAEGSAALYANNSGNYNTAIGVDAMNNNTSGSSNTAIGNHALFSNYSGQYITALGHAADVASNNLFNATAVGSSALATASNQVRVGDNFVNSIGGYVNWSNISDGRVKKNIKQNVPGLAFINKLQPVTYNLDLDAADKIIQYQRKDSTGKIIPLSQLATEARKAKEQIFYTGFIAQDVEKAAKSLNYDFSGVDAAKNSKDLYGLRYAEFVVPLVKAVQELSMQNDSLKDANALLNERLTKIETVLGLNNATAGTSSITSASLQQNIPNPFSSSTIINYNLPQTYSSANIIVTDAKGMVLKQINLTAKGKGNVQLDASTLAAGAYRYSLYVDGKMIDSKQMISSK